MHFTTSVRNYYFIYLDFFIKQKLKISLSMVSLLIVWCSKILLALKCDLSSCISQKKRIRNRFLQKTMKNGFDLLDQNMFFEKIKKDG